MKAPTMANKYTRLPDSEIAKLRARHGRIVEIGTDSDADPVIYCRMPTRTELVGVIGASHKPGGFRFSYSLLSARLVEPQGSFEQIFGDRQGLVIPYANQLLDACGAKAKTTSRVY